MTAREMMMQKLHDYIEDNFDVIPGPSNLLEIVHIVESVEANEPTELRNALRDAGWDVTKQALEDGF